MRVYNVALSLAVASATISSTNASDRASAGVVQIDVAADTPVLDVLSTNADRKLGKSSKSSKGSKGGNRNRAGAGSKSSKGSKSGNVNRAGDDDSSSSKSKKKKRRSNKKKNRAKKNKDTAKREPVIINKADNSETDGKAAATPSPTEAPSKTPTASPTKAPSKTPTASPTDPPSKTPTPSPTDALSKTPTVPLGAVDSYTFTATTFAPTFKPTNTPTVPPSESPVASPKSNLNANTYQCFYEQGINICFTYNDDSTCEMSIENRDCSCCLYTNINHPVIMSFDCTNLGPEWGGMGACLAPDTRAAELNFPSEDGI